MEKARESGGHVPASKSRTTPSKKLHPKHAAGVALYQNEDVAASDPSAGHNLPAKKKGLPQESVLGQSGVTAHPEKSGKQK